MKYNEVPEFSKRFKKLAKKYRSLPSTLRIVYSYRKNLDLIEFLQIYFFEESSLTS